MNDQNLFMYATDFASGSLFSVTDHPNVQNKCPSTTAQMSPATNYVFESTLQEILERLKRLEEKISNQDYRRQVISRLKGIDEQLHDIQCNVDNLCSSLLPKGPVFLYTFVSYERVQSLYLDNQNNPVRFALTLEPLVYADEPWEMQIPLNKRVNSAERVEFIRNCVFRHFNVPQHLQEDIWKNVRTSLDGRARRQRTSARSTPSSGFRTSTPILLNIESNDLGKNRNI